jgi:DNA-binding transcriptional LysR family regulator
MRSSSAQGDDKAAPLDLGRRSLPDCGDQFSSCALRLAALRGVGVCQSPTFVVEEDLRTGRLIDLLPDWAPKAGIIHAAFPSRRGLLPSVRALLDFLAREYAKFGRPGEKTLE